MSVSSDVIKVGKDRFKWCISRKTKVVVFLGLRYSSLDSVTVQRKGSDVFRPPVTPTRGPERPTGDCPTRGRDLKSHKWMFTSSTSLSRRYRGVEPVGVSLTLLSSSVFLPTTSSSVRSLSPTVRVSGSNSGHTDLCFAPLSALPSRLLSFTDSGVPDLCYLQ